MFGALLCPVAIQTWGMGEMLQKCSKNGWKLESCHSKKSALLGPGMNKKKPLDIPTSSGEHVDFPHL